MGSIFWTSPRWPQFSLEVLRAMWKRGVGARTVFDASPEALGVPSSPERGAGQGVHIWVGQARVCRVGAASWGPVDGEQTCLSGLDTN